MGAKPGANGCAVRANLGRRFFDSPAYVDATDVRGVGLSPRDPSELDAQACGRGDILGRA
jgi:hypothetical protein